MRPTLEPLLDEFYSERHNRILLLSASIALLAIALTTLIPPRYVLWMLAIPLWLLPYSLDLRRRLGIGIHRLYPSERDGFKDWIKRRGGVLVRGITLD